MPQPDTSLPAEVVAFIEGLPPGLGYGAIATFVRERFGAASPGVAAIRRWRFGTKRGRKSIFDRDPELRHAVEDLAGLVTLDELLGQLAKRFVGRALPSRSALHRFITQTRRETLLKRP